MPQLPSGWRCTVRALQGWMVKVIRQLCDILFWCLAVRAPRGPSPPHLLIRSGNTWGQTSSDEELVAVDHKKNIRAMSHKDERGKRRRVLNREVDKDGNKEGERRWEQVGERLRRRCGRKIRANDRRRRTRTRNEAKRDGGREKRDCVLWAKWELHCSSCDHKTAGGCHH